MSRRLRYVIAAATAAALLAGCGSDDEPEGKGIPADSVAAIDERLDEIQRRFDEGVDNDNQGACDDIERDSIKAIQATVAELPSDVDPDVRDTLESGIQRLRELAQEGCADIEPTETETIPEETVTETVPEETETVPPETSTQTTPSEELPPGQQKQKKKDKGNDGGTPGQGGGGLPAPVPEDGD